MVARGTKRNVQRQVGTSTRSLPTRALGVGSRSLGRIHRQESINDASREYGYQSQLHAAIQKQLLLGVMQSPNERHQGA
jgi:hypothetical protein